LISLTWASVRGKNISVNQRSSAVQFFVPLFFCVEIRSRLWRGSRFESFTPPRAHCQQIPHVMHQPQFARAEAKVLLRWKNEIGWQFVVMTD
jgi:hypothetical protein